MDAIYGHLDESQMIYFPASLSWWTTPLVRWPWCWHDVNPRMSARLIVLSATGNLRAWFGVFVVGLSAYATFKGLIAETRVKPRRLAL